MKKDTSFYNQDYFQKRDVLPLHFAQTLKLLFQKLGVKKILDVGCGTGKLVEFLNDTGFKATGCDNSSEAIKISKLVKASADNLPFKNSSFECVTAISLIEHLDSEQMTRFLNEAKRVLIPKGYLSLVTPNWQTPLRYLQGENWFAYQDQSHIKYYSPGSLKKILKNHCFENFIFRFRVSREIPNDWPLPLALPKKLDLLINYLLISSPLAKFRNSFWVLCQKRD